MLGVGAGVGGMRREPLCRRLYHLASVVEGMGSGDKTLESAVEGVERIVKGLQRNNSLLRSVLSGEDSLREENGESQWKVSDRGGCKLLFRRVSAATLQKAPEQREERREERTADEVTLPRGIGSNHCNVTPRVSSVCSVDSGWKVVRQRGAQRRVQRAPRMPLECRNSFEALSDDLREEAPKEDEQRQQERTDGSTLSSGKILVMGDSQVRFLDKAFCVRDRRRRTRVCFPGAGIGDVSDRLEDCMINEGVKPIVCLSAGGNDIGRTGSVELLRRYKEALGRIRDGGGVPVVCGILPRVRVSDEWQSKAIAMNSMLEQHCKSNGWTFIDNWDCFYGQDHMYQRDGVNLSQRGVRVLADSLESVITPPFLG